MTPRRTQMTFRLAVSFSVCLSALLFCANTNSFATCSTKCLAPQQDELATSHETRVVSPGLEERGAPIKGKPKADSDKVDDEIALVQAVEEARIKVIDKVIGSVVAIYGDDKGGGGSGVIIDPTGIALTNHHVIMGAGVNGWGGLADGNLYRWKLVGTDPGGDIAIIQLQGKKEFPFSKIGDSDTVKVGDWALAMGNPFVLTEDQVPTVTLGIVSGIERYQYGSGGNQLVYGNCIQMDSSINPGNSGGPLFNMRGEVVGINGRGSFQDRGRVNVGLGYAISSNQIKNFIPDLLATKLTEHGTLDANFSDRDGKVVCSTINLDSVAAENGLELEDELLEFEGIKIRAANQFTNLICTLPQGWPANLLVKKKDGSTKRIVVRLLGLPYQKPKPQPKKGGGGKDGEKEPTPEQKRAIQKQQEMIKLLSAPAGTIRDKELNSRFAERILEIWEQQAGANQDQKTPSAQIFIQDTIARDDKTVGSQKIWLTKQGHYRIEYKDDEEAKTYIFDGQKHWRIDGEEAKEISPTQAKLNIVTSHALSLLAPNIDGRFSIFGKMQLDGSDKAYGRAAYRFKFLDDKEDWYFVWLSMYDSTGEQDIQLIKTSSDMDSGRLGAHRFGHWKVHDGWRIPDSRSITERIGETTRLVFKNENTTTSAEIDETLFQKPGSSSKR